MRAMLLRWQLGTRRPISHWTKAIEGPLNYVHGERRSPGRVDRVKQVLEPSSGQLLCSLPLSSTQDVDEAVTLAHQAQKTWGRLMTPAQRSNVLWKAAQITRDNVDEIALLEVKDSGKPVWEARGDVSACADALQFFAGLAHTWCQTGEQRPFGPSAFAYTRREALGVCAGIGAWNFPFLIATWKAAPALACGNSLVFKPSEITPLSAVTLGEVLTEAGLPPSCYNVIQGDGEVGEELCTHPQVAKVSFTGSVTTGSRVMVSCASTIKRVTLELGGKSPLIIFDDFDVEQAVKVALMANFLSQGQVCSNAPRVFVHRRVLSSFVDRFVVAVNRLKVGDPMSSGTQVGATISQQHADKVLSMIKQAKHQGARVLCGGERVSVVGLEGGVYLSPCVMSEVTDDMDIAREEVFGPVACVLPFDTEQEVIARANNTRFGLAGGVLTSDVGRAHRVVDQLECGSAYINNYNIYPPEIPFGGFKMSGVGRENGLAVIDSYTQLKSVYVQVDSHIDCPLHL